MNYVDVRKKHLAVSTCLGHHHDESQTPPSSHEKQRAYKTPESHDSQVGSHNHQTTHGSLTERATGIGGSRQPENDRLLKSSLASPCRLGHPDVTLSRATDCRLESAERSPHTPYQLGIPIPLWGQYQPSPPEHPFVHFDDRYV